MKNSKNLSLFGRTGKLKVLQIYMYGVEKGM